MAALVWWDDLRFPASAVNPPGLVSDPDLDTNTGCWLYDAAATEVLFFQAQLPHAWKEGSELKPHVHWCKTTAASGNVLWRLEYKWWPIGEVIDASWTTVDNATPVDGTPDANLANQQMITALGTIISTGKQVSDILLIKLSRIGGDGLDTYGADALMIEFDIHYQIDTFGSIGEYIKKVNYLLK